MTVKANAVGKFGVQPLHAENPHGLLGVAVHEIFHHVFPKWVLRVVFVCPLIKEIVLSHPVHALRCRLNGKNIRLEISNLSGLIKNTDSCEEIVNELARPFAE